jgi:hypothetical protein
VSWGGYVKREFVSLAFTVSSGNSVTPGETKNPELDTVVIAWSSGAAGICFVYSPESTASTTFDTTQRCLPILRSRENPTRSYVESAPW